MSKPSKAPKPDPGAIFVCVVSFGSVHGIIREGTRLRGDHPAVVDYEKFFAPDGSPDDEIARKRNIASAPAPVPPPTPALSRVRKMSVAEAVVCVKGFPAGGLMAPVFAGKLFPKGHALVKRYPARFRPATEADMAG